MLKIPQRTEQIGSNVSEAIKVDGIADVFNFFKELCQNIKETAITVLSADEIMKLSYTIFIEKYDQKGALSKYFYSFDLMRQLIFSIILVSSEGEGFGKAVAITVFNFLYLTSCIIIRPYKEINSTLKPS
jgi:hypothetical protein